MFMEMDNNMDGTVSALASAPGLEKVYSMI